MTIKLITRDTNETTELKMLIFMGCFIVVFYWHNLLVYILWIVEFFCKIICYSFSPKILLLNTIIKKKCKLMTLTKVQLITNLSL